MAKVRRLSHTQVTMMLRCPRQWYFRYVKGWKIPPSGAMITGTAFHDVAEVNFIRQMVGGKPVTDEEVSDLYSDSFARESKKDDIDWGKDKPGDLKDDGILLAKNYVGKVAPAIVPTMVEHADTFRMLPSVDMMVIIDVVHAGRKVVDLKVSGKRWSEGKADQEIQQFPYIWYLANLQGAENPWEADIGCEFHINLRNYARKLRTKPDKWGTSDVLVQIEDAGNVLTKGGFELYAEQVTAVAAQIRAGIFPPRCRAAQNIWCSESMCGYWEHCKGMTYKTYVVPDVAEFATTELVPFGKAK